MTHRKFIKKNKISKIIFLVGPTAVGKSRIALSLARKIDAEIISCDSMQVYKRMDIISCKPNALMRRKVRHHLIGNISPVQEYNAARYREHALRAMNEVLRRGKTPLFVGGTGLYTSVLIDGIFKANCQDRDLRNRLYREAGQKGSNYLHARLKKIDPEAACKIHPHDTRRIVRALEVFICCGRPISQIQKERQGLVDKYKVRIFCLNMERDKIYKRIDVRVEKMFKQGLVAEVKRLLKLKLSKTSSYAIGIRELKGHFSGEYDLGQAKQLIKKNTRNYAKRQLTWFRKDKRIEWVGVGEGNRADTAANRILRCLLK